MEMSCDEKVLSKQNGIRKGYSMALLSFASNRHFPAPSPLSFSESGAKSRIKNVLSYEKPKVWLTVFALIICVTVLVSCTANPKAEESVQKNTPVSDNLTTASDISLEKAVSDAIIKNNSGKYSQGNLACESHYIYSTRTGSTDNPNDRNFITVYAQALYTEFEISNNLLTEANQGMSPAVMVFGINDKGNYVLKEYSDFNLIGKDIDKLFPEDVLKLKENFDGSKLQQACFAKAIESSSFDVDNAIEKLFDIIDGNPDVAQYSDLGSYISAKQDEYDLLLDYGDYTLRYIFKEFLKGGQTDLKGALMRCAMEDLIGDEKYDTLAQTGQDYFDEWYKRAIELYEQNDVQTMKESYPKAWMLLEMNYIKD